MLWIRSGFAVIAFVVPFAVFLPASCALSPEVVEIWGGDVSVPEMVSLEPVSENGLVARFTGPVTVLSVSAAVPSDGRVFPASWETGPDKNTVSFSVGGTPGIGVKGMLSGTVSDGKGNTLSFSVPYTGYNTRIPKLRINEVRTSYSKPKVEYIELVALSAGNLGGVEICNVRNEDSPSYEFPAAEVRAGEYLVYHLRSIEDALVNETASLAASGGTEASPLARDFWNTLTNAPLKSDNIILLRERKGGPIMDALLMAGSGLTDWPTVALRTAASEAVAAGAWQPGPLVADAFCSTGMTTTKTAGRNERSDDTNRATDWNICEKSKCTPGFVNVPH